MVFHAAFGLSIEALDVVVVDGSKAMHSFMRGMLTHIGVRRLRFFEDGRSALAACIADPPNVILTACQLEQMSGLQFLAAVRSNKMRALSHIPVLFMTPDSTIAMVQKAALAGAQHVVVKPFSTNTLHARLRWLTSDDRELVPAQEGHVVINGVRETISAQLERKRQLYRRRLIDHTDREANGAGKKAAIHSLQTKEIAKEPAQEAPKEAVDEKKQTPADTLFAPSPVAIRARQRRSQRRQRFSLRGLD